MPVREITVEELAHAIASGREPHLIDVRSETEHEIVRLPRAKLIPLLELSERVEEIASMREEPVVVYCHHGIRSRSGAAILEAAGFRFVASLQGGIDAWAIRIDPALGRY